jgi:O-antigen ligase
MQNMQRTLPGPAPGRRRIALMVVLIAAAMPVRLSQSVPVVNSVSVLDILLVLAAGTLFLDLAFRPLDTGYRELFWILCLPPILTAVSLVWSTDRPATLRTLFSYAEGVIAYLFVIRELAGIAPARIMTYIKRYAYLLIIPAVLLLLSVPGFEPQEPGLKHSSGDYISYFTRLSHPVLGRSNNLAAVLAFFAPLLIYWGHTRQDRRITRAGFITLLAIFVTLSRGTLLAFLIAGVLYALLAPRPRGVQGGSFFPKIAGIVALGALAIAIFYSLNPATNEFFGERLGAANVGGRSDLVSLSFTQIANRPLLGYGGGVIPHSAAVTAQGALLEPVHNTFLQQALYFGLPLGLLVSLALCATAVVFLIRRRSTPLAGVIGYALMVQLVSFLFESSFEGTVLRVLFYLSVGVATALLRSVEAESPNAVAGSP